MIDTVTLIIPEANFTILDHNRFSPCTTNLFEPPFIRVTGRSPFRAVNNPTNQDTLQFGYLPRLTLMKALRRGGFVLFLKVEASLPKLLHGNNFDEVEDSDFKEICRKIISGVFHLGVRIKTENAVAFANVSSVHYSKNIVLDDYTTPYTYLKELNKANVNLALDTNQTDFRNGGHAFRAKGNDFEAVFYDKLKDLAQARKSEKKAIESDNYVQLNLFDELTVRKPFEVLRVEIRIGSRKRLKTLLQKNGIYQEEMNLQQLFSWRISRQLVNSTFLDIVSGYPAMPKSDGSLAERFTEMQLSNPQVGPHQLLKVLGAEALIDIVGVREFRTMIGRCDNSSWYRLHRAMKELKTNTPRKPFETIIEKLQNYDKVTLEDYRGRPALPV